MLTGLRLGNFKAFAETQQLPIKPLTLIFGPNSAGKSSLIHGLVLAHHAIKTGDLDVYKTEIGGESVDLGGFRQYVHKRNKELSVEWGIDIDVSSLENRMAELLKPVKSISISIIFGLYEGVRPEDVTDAALEKVLKDKDKDARDIFKEYLIQSLMTPDILTYEVIAEGKTVLRMSRRPDAKFRLDRLDHEHPILSEIYKNIIESVTTTSIDSLSADDYEGFNDAISELVEEITFEIENALPSKLLRNGQPIESKIPSLLYPISKGSRKENLLNATRNFLPHILYELIHGLSNIVRKEIERLDYLGPLRSYPSRHIAFSQHEDVNWHAGGGYAWDIVRQDYQVRKKINSWLGDKEKLKTPYELTIRYLLTINDLKSQYTDLIEDIEDEFTGDAEIDLDLFGELYNVLDNLEKKERSLSDIQELHLIDKRTNTIVSHRDVGIGISQVLPVLVKAYASENKIIAIEQPEIHLHPSLQAELGDVLIESALGENNNTFIIETHSEHLILRILRRIRETSMVNKINDIPVKPDDIAILYIDANKSGSQVKEIRVDERGRFIDQVPGGFFEEGFEELF